MSHKPATLIGWTVPLAAALLLAGAPAALAAPPAATATTSVVYRAWATNITSSGCDIDTTTVVANGDPDSTTAEVRWTQTNWDTCTGAQAERSGETTGTLQVPPGMGHAHIKAKVVLTDGTTLKINTHLKAIEPASVEPIDDQRYWTRRAAEVQPGAWTGGAEIYSITTVVPATA